MNDAALTNPALDATLTELAALGMRAARVVVWMMELEQASAAVIGQWLPEGAVPAAGSESHLACLSVDAVELALKDAVPRVEVLARSLDRVSRSVRRSVALLRRMQAGWPGAGSADTRQAMVKRQVARGVAEAIRRGSDGEPPERLFDELAERLDEPGIESDFDTLPVEEVVRRICRDLGLAGAGLAATLPAADTGGRGVPDTG